MKLPATAWSARRWLLTVLLLFSVQVGFILFFSELPWKGAAAPPGTSFRLMPRPLDDGQLAASFFASDPTLFAAAALHGARERSWTRLRAQRTKLPEPEEPIHWLTLEPHALGASLPIASGQRTPFPFEHTSPSRSAESLRFFFESDLTPTQSLLRIDSSLAKRQILPVGKGKLKSWPSSEVLTNSVVQLGVSDAGEVVSTRLLSRCGLNAADQEAIAMARRLRFAPIGRGDARHLSWGWVDFQWHTAPSEASATQTKAR